MKKVKLLTPNQGEFFCQQYWRSVLKNQPVIHYKKSIKNFAGKIHALNMDIVYQAPKRVPRMSEPQKMYSRADLEFKVSEKLDKSRTFWRGLNEPTYNKICVPPKHVIDLFYKCKKLKAGDILYMREYPFASKDKSIAKSYLFSLKDAILYKIKAPKGASVLFYNDSNVIISRYTKFLCTKTKEIKTKDKTYQQINLTLLPSDFEPPKKKLSLIEKIKNLFK